MIGLALATLRENKVRSFLTLLGVMIGTGTIIGVGSILTGLDGAVTGAIRSLGTNTAIVMKIGPSFGGGRTPEQRMRRPLTYENALAIAERCPSVEHVSPILQPPNGILRARYKSNDAFQLQMFGTSEYYATAGQADLKAGRFFTDAEDRHRMSVAVIGQDIYKQLFGKEDALGKTILVAGHQLASDRRDESSRHGSAGPERQSRDHPVLHHAQGVSHRAGAPADGAGQGRAIARRDRPDALRAAAGTPRTS